MGIFLLARVKAFIDLWSSWISLSLGRPSSICEPSSNIPIPNPDSLLCSLVALSRIMSTCASRIHKQDHESLLSIWTAANDIRRDLLAFAEQQREVMGFEMASDPQTGEKGVWQTIISTSKWYILFSVVYLA